MKNTLTLALALTLLAGTGSAFAQGQHDRDHKAPPVTTQRSDDHGRNTPPVTQQRTDNRGDHRDMPAMNMRGPAHPDWRAGGHIGRTDWRRGEVINYRDHHLRRPPRGYEWRQVDGNYVLAAAATGLIASIILASH